jgi:heme oxygenase (biliverdin-IX-beta and delta-forming)
MKATLIRRPDDVRAILRDETQQEHERLHRLPVFAALEAGTASREDYVTLMQGLYRFYLVFERRVEVAVARLGGSCASYEPIDRTGRLSADLRHLGCQCGAQPPAGGLPVPRTAAELAGMLYVADGSLLGTAVLAPRARAIGGDQGAGYWEWGRVNAGARWRRTCALVEEVGGAGDLAGMIASAKATFTSFAMHFEAGSRC